jgi:uncharacterized protein (UPF0332 family)
VRSLFDLDECLAKGLIRKIPPSGEQAKAAISKAKILLEEAEADLEDRRFNSVVMIAYAAMLNAAKAILFRDGYRERSHACVVRYLEARYKSKIPADSIALLDHYRETRHEVQYDSSYLAGEESAQSMLAFAQRFITMVDNLL